MLIKPFKIILISPLPEHHLPHRHFPSLPTNFWQKNAGPPGIITFTGIASAAIRGHIIGRPQSDALSTPSPTRTLHLWSKGTFQGNEERHCLPDGQAEAYGLGMTSWSYAPCSNIFWCSGFDNRWLSR